MQESIISGKNVILRDIFLRLFELPRLEEDERTPKMQVDLLKDQGLLSHHEGWVLLLP